MKKKRFLELFIKSFLLFTLIVFVLYLMFILNRIDNSVLLKYDDFPSLFLGMLFNILFRYIPMIFVASLLWAGFLRTSSYRYSLSENKNFRESLEEILGNSIEEKSENEWTVNFGLHKGRVSFSEGTCLIEGPWIGLLGMQNALKKKGYASEKKQAKTNK